MPTQPKKLLKLSKIRVDKKTVRTSKNEARKLMSLLFPLSLVCAVISGVFLFSLITTLQKPAYLSPLSNLGIEAIRPIDDSNRQILEKLLKEKKIAHTKITPGPDSSYIIHLSGGEEATVSFDKDIKSQISSLQFILSRLTMEGRQFSRLDLRFDKPIIIFK
jgi:hypothetical protein